MREKLIELLGNIYLPMTCGPDTIGEYCIPHKFKKEIADHLIANGVVVLPLGGIGEMSDGYHTFNELYHHRAVLFSVICNARPDLAWKSKLHDTGDMYEGMFIVGIETKEGQATYHYDIDPYWDMFNVPVLDRAPVWDGHTPQQAIDRIANGVVISNSETTTKWIPVTDENPKEAGEYIVKIAYASAATALWYNPVEDVWFSDDYRDTYPVTHWMYMPDPPKGE